MTIWSPTTPLQIWVQNGFPHGPARQASTSPVFRPAYTTPFASVGDESTSAWVPVPKSVQSAWHRAWPHPAAA